MSMVRWARRSFEGRWCMATIGLAPRRPKRYPTRMSDDPIQRPHRSPLRRLLLFLGIAAFAGFGFFFFGARMPIEIELRFELPPTLRAPGIELPRERVTQVSAQLVDAEGQRVAAVDLPLPQGLVGPRTGPVVLNLKKGTYGVRARVRGPLTIELPMDGVAEVSEREVIVDLKTAR